MLAETPVTFHLSINVAELDRSVEFFRKVFGIDPAKHRRDYAKFELQNPPITFSLEPLPPAERGVLNHVGFKLQSAEALVALQRRLELAGLRSEREEGVECCYSKQTKFWLHDPDGTLWEMYVLEEDIDHRGAGQSEAAVQGPQPPSPPPASIRCEIGAQPTPADRVTWSHRLGSPLEVPEKHTASSLDAIHLQGTFNAAGTEHHLTTFLQTVTERLKPGGRLTVHCLTSDRPLAETPVLPGPASVVKAVPELDQLIDAAESTGLQQVRLTKYGRRACFTAGEAELRETMLEAFKPAAATPATVTVVYAGPGRELRLDDGTVLRRGRRTTLPRTAVESLQASPLGETITVMEPAGSAVACTAP